MNGTLSRTNTTLRRQAGISLVELMVGITIGLLVTLAGLGIQLGVQLTATTLGDRSRLQDRGEAVLRNIAAQVESAAALSLTQTAPGDSRVHLTSSAYGLNPANTGGQTGLHVFGFEGGASPDSLMLSYQSEAAANAGQVLDCVGVAAAGPGNTVDNTYVLAADSVLRCTGSNGGNSPVSLAEGVEDFQVLYGIKSGSWTTRTVQWRDATAIAGGGLWAQVQAVQVCIQLVGEMAGNPTAGDRRTGCRGQALPDDGRLRLVLSRVFVMRNMLLERE